MNKAYSQLEIKSFDAEKRQIRGVATTPKPDRDGDIIDPKGANFTLPIPFLWQHKMSEPIGHVTEAKVTAKGIEVLIQLVKIEEVGTLKDRIDEAWQSIKSGLVRGLSIGFRPMGMDSVSIVEGNNGLHFKEWDWYELSAVTIPANIDGKITEIKSVEPEVVATDEKPKVDPELIVGDTTKYHVVKLNMPTKAGVKLL